MIEQVGQGRMLARLEQATWFQRRSAALLVLIALPALCAPAVRALDSPAAEQRESPAVEQRENPAAEQRESNDAKRRERIEQAQRVEGEAILAIADAVMAGKSVPSDFAVRWQNDFVKAQRGTFVPFTLTVDASGLSRQSALVYVRAARRTTDAPAPHAGDRNRKGRETSADAAAEGRYPVDAIFPVDLKHTPGLPSRISRGFSVLPGEYDVFVVMRERVDPVASRPQPKAAVLRQLLSVPDFWSNELTTSSMILADRLDTLPEPVPSDQLSERPYVIGRNEIMPAFDRRFTKNEELIVVFLVYNPMVTAERQFDVRVEYHFFRKLEPGGQVDGPASASMHPPPRAGEKYFNHTDPQRFNPALMGTGFDPSGGEPVMAGQVVPLAGFQEGDYRLAVQIIDLLSGKLISRDVLFTVGS